MVQNGTQADVSPERLADLESSIRRFGARSADGLAAVCAEFEQRRRALADQEEEARCEVDRCRRALEDQDDNQQDDGAEAALEEAEARLEGIRRWTGEVNERFGWFGREAARFQGLLEDRVPAAACFLQEKVRHLHDYHATGLDQPDIAAGPSPPGATVPAPGKAPPTDRRDGPGEVRLADYSLPRGFKWVPLSEIDLPKELEGLSSREDFRKVPYEAMREGCLRLKNEVLPRLQLPMTGSANDCFRELDSARGVPYSDGLLRVYEAFFGQHDFVYFVRRTPSGPLDIVNGRHRVKMAVDLGWDAVPAQVKE